MLRALIVSVFVGLVGSVLVAATAAASPDPQAEQPRVMRPEVPELAAGKPFDTTGWTRLGQVVLSGQQTSATVRLKMPKTAVGRLALVVDGELDLSSVTVGGGGRGGGRVMRGARHHFWASAPAKEIDLPRAEKRLRTVSVSYALAKAATVTLTVYGRATATAGASASTSAMKSDEPTATLVSLDSKAPAADTGISARQGWTLLGVQTVDGTRDTDVIKVSGETQSFDRLALVVSGGDLELRALKLRFDGGKTADLGSTYYFRGDDRSRIMSLPAGAMVTLVQLKYGSERGAGKTRVEVWAR
jgi:hypothetical protein